MALVAELVQHYGAQIKIHTTKEIIRLVFMELQGIRKQPSMVRNL